MKPTFKNSLDWQKAEILMQPTFIRVMDNLRKQLEQSHWLGTYQEIQTPYPGHQLSLTHQEHSVKINVWDICFRVCFVNYELPLNQNQESSLASQEVEIDTSLIDDTGQVNWQLLDTKVQRIIQEMLSSLPIN